MKIFLFVLSILSTAIMCSVKVQSPHATLKLDFRLPAFEKQMTIVSNIRQDATAATTATTFTTSAATATTLTSNHACTLIRDKTTVATVPTCSVHAASAKAAAMLAFYDENDYESRHDENRDERANERANDDGRVRDWFLFYSDLENLRRKLDVNCDDPPTVEGENENTSNTSIVRKTRISFERAPYVFSPFDSSKDDAMIIDAMMLDGLFSDDEEDEDFDV